MLEELLNHDPAMSLRVMLCIAALVFYIGLWLGWETGYARGKQP